MYYPHINQELKRISFDIPLPELQGRLLDQVLEDVDDWIKDIFDEMPELPLQNVALPDSEAWLFAVAYLSRALGLSCHLLQLIRIPVFHPGVLECLGSAPQPSYVRVTAAVPFHEFYPAQVYQSALSLAFELLSEFLHKSRQPEARKCIQDNIQSQFVKIWQDIPISNGFVVPILQEAYRRNIPIRQVTSQAFQLGWGSRSHLVQASALDTSSALGASIAQDKMQTARLLKALGVPAPEHLPVTTLDEAQAAALHLGYPVVVKPNDRDRGEGVSIDVTNLNQLREAWSKARAFSANILIEKQVPGICHRIYIANDELVFVLRRRPKSVRGDGQKTIRELIEYQAQIQAKQPPWKRGMPFPIDDLTVQCLAGSGLALETILCEGEWANLRPMESHEWGGVVEDVTKIVHPHNVLAARAIASYLGLRIAGLDIVSQDIAVACNENNAVFIEVNYAPSTNFTSASSALIESAFSDDGRVPIEVFVGSQDAMEMARSRQQDALSHGESVFLLVNRDCFLPTGGELFLGCPDLASCSRALLMRRDLDRLLIVVDDPTRLTAELPFDSVTSVHVCPSSIDVDISKLQILIPK